MFFSYYLFGQLGLNYALTLIATILSLGLLGLLLDKFIFRNLRENIHSSIMASLGLTWVIGTFAVVVFGEDVKNVPDVLTGVARLLGVTISWERIGLILSSIVLVIITSYFVHWTKMGKSLLAVQQDPDAAALQGIDTNRACATAFFLSAALAGAAGALWAPVFVASPFLGEPFVIKAAVVVVIGGLGSVPGAVVGGLFLGFFESIITTFIGAAFTDLAAWIVLIVILTFRPWGLIGRAY